MSDYIRKSDLHGVNVFKREKDIPTISEAEIIRKAFERVIERLEEEKGIAFLTLANTGNKMKDIVYDEVIVYLNTAIEIVKEESRMNEN